MKYLLALIGTFVFTAMVASAQTGSVDLALQSIPLNPQPGETVTITASSYGTDLSQTTLSWNYNGSSVGQGVGKTSIQVVAPKAGTTGIITVTTIDGGTASTILRPGTMDLLWEAADAYTPPFYKGKALLPLGGLIRLTAVSSTNTPRGISFDWERNTSAMQEASGFGKSSTTFRYNPLNASEQVSVTATSGNFQATASLRLGAYVPLALAYRNNDGFIDYAHGYTTTIPITTTGAVLHFEPYYFSVPSTIAKDLSVGMVVNKQPILTAVPNEIALSRPENGVQSTLELAITTVAYSLQHLTKTFTLLFN